MKQFSAKSPEASRLRQRKYELVRKYGIPEDLVGGCLSRSHRRCGKWNCHCAEGRGHPMWSVTFSHRGQRRVERVPVDWVEEVEAAVLSSQAYLDAIKEVQRINLELLAQTRAQRQARRKKAKRGGSNSKTAAIL